MKDLLAHFPVITTFPVHWGEMDAYGHVNNAAYLRYFETARIAYFGSVGEEFVAGTRIGPILAEVSVRYRLPLTHPDTVRVGARTSAIYEHGFLHEYQLFSEKSGAIAASGTARIVTYDYAAGKKVPLPDGVRARLEAIEGRALPVSAPRA